VVPPDIQEATDYRSLSVEALAALRLANARNAALRRCDAKVIDDYAKAARE
jgi:chromosome condensin MukBEF ATPase and DNA-binding subunit MukB